MHNTNCPFVRSVALYRLVIRENEWRVETEKKSAGWNLIWSIHIMNTMYMLQILE